MSNRDPVVADDLEQVELTLGERGPRLRWSVRQAGHTSFVTCAKIAPGAPPIAYRLTFWVSS